MISFCRLSSQDVSNLLHLYIERDQSCVLLGFESDIQSQGFSQFISRFHADVEERLYGWRSKSLRKGAELPPFSDILSRRLYSFEKIDIYCDFFEVAKSSAEDHYLLPLWFSIFLKKTAEDEAIIESCAIDRLRFLDKIHREELSNLDYEGLQSDCKRIVNRWIKFVMIRRGTILLHASHESGWRGVYVFIDTSIEGQLMKIVHNDGDVVKNKSIDMVKEYRIDVIR